MIYQDINFKICLSLFGWKENILFKQHIVQWSSGNISSDNIDLKLIFQTTVFLTFIILSTIADLAERNFGPIRQIYFLLFLILIKEGVANSVTVG